ncbi:uncharacterized protein EI90DRAFT_1766043 [Cantharellus anzutake]|uniref:uncharacterized protein n=1 Tax=Cantharellus anzutake TaxID=1750568 RepID=UPI001905986E|nr:uncharacterized protein EI90DRAFT_1766043 [Cantharellus anzutake]KAF8327558.1 hypothetical protein EI90DRAFT_1766043 [Cantharellus anzutake]
MAGDSGPHMDTDSRKPRHPNLVFMDEEGGLRFWVHPSLPERPEITDRIERHGGKVVDSIRPAYLAITDDEFCDNKELREHPLRTIGVMPQWVQDSIDAGKIQDFEDYLVVYHRPDTEEGASGIESSPENELRAGTVMEVDGGDDNGSDPDRSSNEDSDWVVQAAKDFFSDSPRATLESFYRWCANKRKHRSEDYWKKFIKEVR